MRPRAQRRGDQVSGWMLGAVLLAPAFAGWCMAGPAPSAGETEVFAAVEPPWGPHMQPHQTPHFVIWHRNSPKVADLTGRLLERMHGDFHRLFPQDRSQPPRRGETLVWLCFDDRDDYERYGRAADGMDMSWTQAFYSARTNRVALLLTDHDSVVQTTRWIQSQTGDARQVLGASRIDQPARADVPPTPGGQRAAMILGQITHEAVHQLAFSCGIQKRGVLYPLWASEGLATNFEIDVNGHYGFGHDNPLRRAALTRAAQDDRLLDLGRFVVLSRVPTDRLRSVNDLYAQAWAFFRFLHLRHGEGLKRYLSHLAQLEPGWRSQDTLGREFVQAFGPMQTLADDWHAFVAELTGDDGE